MPPECGFCGLDGWRPSTAAAPAPPWSSNVARLRYEALPLTVNSGRDTTSLRVQSKADRPVQVGSHYHFFEVNPALYFDRTAAYGFRLDIPAGTTLRFEPGDLREVNLVAIGGARIVNGLAGLVNGSLDDPNVYSAAKSRLSDFLQE